MNCGRFQAHVATITVVAVACLFMGASRAVTDDSSGPLPTVNEVLKRIVERSRKDGENDRQFDERYEYERVKTREVRTAKGKLKQCEVTSRRNQPRGPNPAAHPANPVAASAANHEARDLETREDHDRFRNHGDYGKKDFPITHDLLGRFEFFVAGRETLNGRSTLILDFKPAGRDRPTKTFLDRFINRMAGRLWVDESEAVITKADLKLTETVSFIAGLAGAVYQLDCGFERSRTDDGLWYTPEFAWHADWRELLARKVVSVRETKDEVRPAKGPEALPKESTARIELP